MTWARTGPDARASVEPDFLSLPLSAVADSALGAARALGASHADVRVSRQRSRRASAAAFWRCSVFTRAISRRTSRTRPVFSSCPVAR